MYKLFDLVSFAAYVAIALRVFVYRRNGARHRAHVSWIAWAIVAIAGASAIEAALHARHAVFLQAARSALLALFVFGARGNVAQLLWSDEQ